MSTIQEPPTTGSAPFSEAGRGTDTKPANGIDPIDQPQADPMDPQISETDNAIEWEERQKCKSQSVLWEKSNPLPNVYAALNRLRDVFTALI